jgi:hypothetical protein
VTEIETLIPLLMQESPRRLRRATLIGDQRQLPPVRIIDCRILFVSFCIRSFIS